MDVCLIWAQGAHREIGLDNTLPWALPEDLVYFKALTLGFPVVMGRRTYESLPVRPLPGRLNIVVSTTWQAETVAPTGAVHIVPGIAQALAKAGEGGSDKVFVIGGAQLFDAALPYATVAYVTEVAISVPGADTFAPSLGPDWCCTPTEWRTSRNGLRYRMLVYRKENLSRG